MSKSDSIVDEVYILNHGSLIRDRIEFVGERAGVATSKVKNPTRTLLELPVTSFLLKTADGYILIDSGFHENVHRNIKGEASARDLVRYGPEYSIRANLKKLHLAPIDVKLIMLTHLHYDHAGGLHEFEDEGVRVLIQKSELQAALMSIWGDPRPTSFYQMRDVPKKENVSTIDAPFFKIDEGIGLYRVGGHTPGSQIVHVRTKKSKEYLLMGDFVHLQEEYDSEVTGFATKTTDYYQWRDSLSMVKLIADLRAAKVLINHDPRLLKENPSVPKPIS